MFFRLIRKPDDSEERLDRFLHGRLPEISRGTLRKIIELGGVHLQGRRCLKCATKVGVGQQVELYRDEGLLDPFRIAAEHILFQDDFLIVINKPAGIDSQPTSARYRGTLYEAVQIWLQGDRRGGRSPQIGMAQRLDRDTSGVIVFSIHPLAHKELTRQLTERIAEKEYLAIISGRPEEAEGRFQSRLIRDRRSGRMGSTGQGGQEAITDYRLLATKGEFSLVHIHLRTGRTHQIRAHFAEAGHPLAGDVRYGGPAEKGGHTFSRQCLHSWRLTLSHPLTGTRLTWTAPLPKDMECFDWQGQEEICG
jgi:23S rRNA pseudouridine1911/1915/1917 synthase